MNNLDSLIWSRGSGNLFWRSRKTVGRFELSYFDSLEGYLIGIDLPFEWGCTGHPCSNWDKALISALSLVDEGADKCELIMELYKKGLLGDFEVLSVDTFAYLGNIYWIVPDIDQPYRPLIQGSLNPNIPKDSFKLSSADRNELDSMLAEAKRKGYALLASVDDFYADYLADFF